MKLLTVLLFSLIFSPPSFAAPNCSQLAQIDAQDALVKRLEKMNKSFIDIESVSDASLISHFEKEQQYFSSNEAPLPNQEILFVSVEADYESKNGGNSSYTLKMEVQLKYQLEPSQDQDATACKFIEPVKFMTISNTVNGD